MTATQTSEHEPLLSAIPPYPHPQPTADPTPTNNIQWTPALVKRLAFVFTLNFIACIVVEIFPGALAQLVETNLCRRRHGDVQHPTTDPRCKDNHVQSELSMVLAASATCESILCILTAIPYGMLADRFGRKPVISATLTGIICHSISLVTICTVPGLFSAKMICAAALFTLIGGGGSAYWAAMDAMLCDIIPSEHRTSALFWNIAIQFMGNFVGGFVGYAVLRQGAAFAFLCGIGALLVLLLLSFVLPETLKRDKKQIADQQGQKGPLSVSKVTQQVLASLKESAGSLRSVLIDNPRLRIAFLVWTFAAPGTYTYSIFMQYVAKRYHFSWAETNLITSIKTGIKIALTLVIMPAINQALVKSNMPLIKKDAWIARACLALTTIGLIGIGLAVDLPQLVVALVFYSIVSGFMGAIKSLLAQLFAGDNLGLLFGAMWFVLNVTILVASPLSALMFTLGLTWGEAWTGLPFLVFGGLMVVSNVLLLFVREEDARH